MVGAVSGGLGSARNGLARDRVADIQRVRMLAAMVEVVAERGVGGVTVAHVVARSGVSRRTFYEIFEDREDCFLAAFDDGVERIGRVVVSAYGGQARWRDAVRAGLMALLGCLEDEPHLGRLVVVEALGAGSRALERRRRVVDVLVGVVDRGRGEGRAGRGLPALTAESVVGAVLSVLHARLSAEPPKGFVDLLNPLVAMIVLPYLGRAAADRELERPAAPLRANATPTVANPLHDLHMRLTYRTVRVLMALAERPGSSNRTVADGSGVVDQGQISKLLTRLHGLGLVENTGAGPARGEPNAWTLTQKGWEIHGAIAQQTPSA